MARSRKPRVELRDVAYRDLETRQVDAWKSELQQALQNDAYGAVELKRKVEAHILRIDHEHINPNEHSRKTLLNDVSAICAAPVFERFRMLRSQTPAGKRKTTAEIKQLATLSARLAAHIKNMHQTSREIVERIEGEEGDLTFLQLEMLERLAASAAIAANDRINRLVNVPLIDQSSGRKANKSAESVTRIAAEIFKRRTRRPPARLVNRISGEAGGPFIEWLTELFSLLKIEASADAETRKFLEQISMDTIAKK